MEEDESAWWLANLAAAAVVGCLLRSLRPLVLAARLTGPAPQNILIFLRVFRPHASLQPCSRLSTAGGACRPRKMNVI